MNIKRLTTFIAGVFATTAMLSAQSYFDDDIYYDASKATKPAKKSVNNNANKQNTVIVYDYPSADNFTVNGTRKISVDDYNRRGIFATDSLTSDTTATDFAYTRRIEQFYNPEIVSGSGDQELANIYYMEPDQVNIYVNTPSGYWGYDYFYPYTAWTSPYWYNNYWRWNSDGIGDRGMILTGLGTGDPHGGRHGHGGPYGDRAGAGDLHGASGIPDLNGRQTYWQVGILPTPETIARLAIEGLTMDQTVRRTTIIDLHTTTEDRA